MTEKFNGGDGLHAPPSVPIRSFGSFKTQTDINWFIRIDKTWNIRLANHIIVMPGNFKEKKRLIRRAVKLPVSERNRRN